MRAAFTCALGCLVLAGAGCAGSDAPVASGSAAPDATTTTSGFASIPGTALIPSTEPTRPTVPAPTVSGPATAPIDPTTSPPPEGGRDRERLDPGRLEPLIVVIGVVQPSVADGSVTLDDLTRALPRASLDDVVETTDGVGQALPLGDRCAWIVWSSAERAVLLGISDDAGCVSGVAPTLDTDLAEPWVPGALRELDRASTILLDEVFGRALRATISGDATVVPADLARELPGVRLVDVASSTLDLVVVTDESGRIELTTIGPSGACWFVRAVVSSDTTVERSTGGCAAGISDPALTWSADWPV